MAPISPRVKAQLPTTARRSLPPLLTPVLSDPTAPRHCSLLLSSHTGQTHRHPPTPKSLQQPCLCLDRSYPIFHLADSLTSSNSLRSPVSFQQGFLSPPQVQTADPVPHPLNLPFVSWHLLLLTCYIFISFTDNVYCLLFLLWCQFHERKALFCSLNPKCLEQCLAHGSHTIKAAEYMNASTYTYDVRNGCVCAPGQVCDRCLWGDEFFFF